MLGRKINRRKGGSPAGKVQKVRLANELDRLQKLMATVRWHHRLECPGKTPSVVRRVTLNID